jgi:hypothetical protein
MAHRFLRMCCAICSQTRKQFAGNLITSYLMVDDKEKNGEPISPLFFGTDIPSSQHKELLALVSFSHQLKRIDW